MSGSATAAAVRVRGRASGEDLVLRPRQEIGAGGEARVFAHPGDPSRVVKLYHRPDAAREAKVRAMLANPPRAGEEAGFAFAWPLEAVEDEGGAFRGFVMPRAEGPRIFELLNPVTRRSRAPWAHHGRMHRAGRNLARAFAALHAAGYVVGDVNESNLLVSRAGVVTLVDADSFQVREAAGEGGALHRSRVGKAEFTPPELQGVAFAETDRAPAHDRFGLAVLLFQLLMEGTHPFAGQYPALAEPPPTERRIREGHFAYAGRPGAPCRPPRLAPPFGILHPALQALFLRAFGEGHADPARRPAAEEWAAALEHAEAALLVCDHNLQHRFGTHLALCPWCERAALLGGRDPFPPRPFGSDEEDERAEAPAAPPAGSRRRARPAARMAVRSIRGVTAPPPPVPIELDVPAGGILGVTTPPRTAVPAGRWQVRIPAMAPLPPPPPPPPAPRPVPLAARLPGPGLPVRAAPPGAARALLPWVVPVLAASTLAFPRTHPAGALLVFLALALAVPMVPDLRRPPGQLLAATSLTVTLTLVVLFLAGVAERGVGVRSFAVDTTYVPAYDSAAAGTGTPEGVSTYDAEPPADTTTTTAPMTEVP